MLLPKEHGAYGQMAFPLVTSAAVAGITGPSALLLLAVVAGFLAHEPLLVLLNHRGARVRAACGEEARRMLLLVGGIGIASGIAALLLAPPSVRWTFLCPAIPAIAVAVAIACGREKQIEGELAAAAAFGAVAVPVCMLGGETAGTALAVAAAFIVAFVSATLAVRTVILRVRGGGNPRAVRVTRTVFWTFALIVLAMLLPAISRGTMPGAALVAIAPALMTAAAVALFPPPPKRLRALGWTLVAATTATALVLVAAL